MAKSDEPEEIAGKLEASLERAFALYFARTAPDLGEGRAGRIGVRLEDVAEDGTALNLVLTFRSGERYPSTQLACQCDFRDGESWTALRQAMRAHGLGDFRLPTIRTLRVIVQEGATFDPDESRGTPIRSEGAVYEAGPFPPVLADAGDP